MKRQAIFINLEILDRIKTIIEKELKELEIFALKAQIKNKEKIGFQFDIVNYPTAYGKKKKYLSDTWQFDFDEK